MDGELAHVLDRDDDLEVELLAHARVDELDLTTRSGDEAADLVERPLCGREADALERLLDELLEALEREREVRAALRPGDRVHLVEDHVSIPRSVSRACEVRSRKSDSGVVMRMSGGVRSIRRRSSAGVSPVRTATDELRAEPGERARAGSARCRS